LAITAFKLWMHGEEREKKEKRVSAAGESVVGARRRIENTSLIIHCAAGMIVGTEKNHGIGVTAQGGQGRVRDKARLTAVKFNGHQKRVIIDGKFNCDGKFGSGKKGCLGDLLGGSTNVHLSGEKTKLLAHASRKQGRNRPGGIRECWRL